MTDIDQANSDTVDQIWKLVMAVKPGDVPVLSRDEVLAALLGRDNPE